jgi:Domain of unknown function (DUF4188)
MPDIIPARMSAQLDGDFVVFLIGMRVNKWWKFWKWMPVAKAMPKMLTELAGRPELGLLHARTVFGFPNLLVIQYWRSFEQLHAYAPIARFNICRPGANSIARSHQTATSVSGTRPISCRLALMSASTTTCQFGAWLPRVAWCLPRDSARAPRGACAKAMARTSP